MEILKDLFDRNLIEILNLFIDNPENEFSLTEISKITKINMTGTFRIVNNLIKKNFIKEIPIGKRKNYMLEKNKKTEELMKILKTEEAPLEMFIKELSKEDGIDRIILESKEKNTAKLLLIGDLIDSEKIYKLSATIKEKYNYSIIFVGLSVAQYKSLKSFKEYNLDRKVLWDRIPFLQAK
jgi:hypothetical protein